LQVWYLICSYVGGVVFAGLVSLTSSPYSSELFAVGRVWSASRFFICVRVCVCRLGTFGFLWEREKLCELYS